MTLLTNLNSGQREAATTLEGPVLILAGAGTGKNARHYVSHRSSHRAGRAGQRDSCRYIHEQGSGTDEGARP